MQKFKFLPHTADIKFQAFGANLNECFENACLALTSIFCKSLINSIKSKKIKVKGKDLENLLYNFLEEILFIRDVDDFVVKEIKSLKILGAGEKLKKRHYQLEAELLGDDIKNCEKGLDVKAVTYHNMFIKQERIKGRTFFVCQVVVDV